MLADKHFTVLQNRKIITAVAHKGISVIWLLNINKQDEKQDSNESLKHSYRKTRESEYHNATKQQITQAQGSVALSQDRPRVFSENHALILLCGAT